MNPLVEAIDCVLAFVRDHPHQMTREQVNHFNGLAELVYRLIPDNWLPRLPQVPELLRELESENPPLPPVQFISKLNLPGDWERVPVAGPLPSSWPDTDEPPALPDPVFLVCATPRWLADLEALRRLALEAEPPPLPPPPPPPPQRLTVDLAKKTITLDGQSYDIVSVNALRWVKVLSDHPRDWISSSKLKNYDKELDGCRPDRLNKQLPDAIRTLIESQDGVGSRIIL
jgi:hypothetical protein